MVGAGAHVASTSRTQVQSELGKRNAQARRADGAESIRRSLVKGVRCSESANPKVPVMDGKLIDSEFEFGANRAKPNERPQNLRT